MKSKQLQKVAIVLSCMSLSQAIASDSYELNLRFLRNNEPRTEHHVNLTQMQRVIIADSREKMITVNGHQKVMRTNGLGLGDDNAKIIESFLSGDTEIRPTDKQVVLTQTEKSEIARNGFSEDLLIRLEKDINRSSSEHAFYSFSEAYIPAGVQIEDGKLMINCASMPITFRVEKCGFGKIMIHILESGIENNVFLNICGNINTNAEGVYNRWEDLVDIVPYGEGLVYSNEGKPYTYTWRISNLNQMPELLRTLNFSRSLAKKTKRSLHDIRGFLGCLEFPGFFANEMTVIKHSEAKHYSLNLICDDSLMAELRFKDESDDTEWYQDQYAILRILDFDNPIFPDTFRDRSFILESITLGTYTYKFTRRVDLLKKYNGFTLLDLSRGSDTIYTRLRSHMNQVFSANRIGDEHGNVEKAYSQIDLAKVMQGIEEDFADN